MKSSEAKIWNAKKKMDTFSYFNFEYTIKYMTMDEVLKTSISTIIYYIIKIINKNV